MQYIETDGVMKYNKHTSIYSPRTKLLNSHHNHEVDILEGKLTSNM